MPELRRLWEGWKAFAHSLGDFQARVLLTVFYFTVLSPYGLVMSAFGNALRIRPVDVRRVRSAWESRRSTEEGLARARQTF